MPAPPDSESRRPGRGSGFADAPILGRDRLLEAALLGLFALLLALVTMRHEMWRDEMQAWLIARDSTSVASMFDNMRFEGHPALWYLLLYLPAHISPNPVSMQALNYAFALGEAWLIVSARKLALPVRALSVFSFFVFYQYGVVARSYMLALLLLTAAARCLVSHRPRRALAVALVVLAVNTHLFAIPVALVLAAQRFYLARFASWKDWAKPLQRLEFWAVLASLVAATALALATVHPPADFASVYTGAAHSSTIYNLEFSQGLLLEKSLHSLHVTRGSLDELASSPAWILAASLPSLAALLLIAAALRSSAARFVFLASTALELVTMAITVKRPHTYHYGMIFAGFLAALILDAASRDAYGPQRGQRGHWLSPRAAQAVLLTVLGALTLWSVQASIADWKHPYSEAKETADWLRQSGLDKNPIAVEPDYRGAAVVGYLERPSVYYPACRCFGSFILWRIDRDQDRDVTEPELEALAKGSAVTPPLPPVVVSGYPLPAETLKSLRLQELRVFDRPSIEWESFYVYRWLGP